jgi:hypothetical protein
MRIDPGRSKVKHACALTLAGEVNYSCIPTPPGGVEHACVLIMAGVRLNMHGTAPGGTRG